MGMSIAATIGGIIGGLVGTLIIWLIALAKRKPFVVIMSNLKIVLGVYAISFLGFSLLIMLSSLPAAIDRNTPMLNDARFKVAMAKHGQRLQGHPEYKKVIETVKTKDAAGQLGEKLAMDGFQRIGSKYQLERVRLLGVLIEKSNDPKLCAGLFTGRLEGVPLTGYIGMLDDKDLEAWAEMSFESMVATLEKRPKAALTAEENEQVFAALAASMPEADYTRLMHILQKIDMSSQEDQCWGMKTLVSSTPKLPPPNNERLALLMATQ